MQVAHKSRWDPLAGPALRARTAGWLWLGPTTLAPAIQHTNALLREFALGGGPSADAALLLLEALPQEFLSLLGSPVRVSPPCIKQAVVKDMPCKKLSCLGIDTVVGQDQLCMRAGNAGMAARMCAPLLLPAGMAGSAGASKHNIRKRKSMPLQQSQAI